MNKITYKIKNIAEVVGGGTPSTTIEDYWDGDIPWISPSDLTGYTDVYIGKGKKSITELGYKNSSTKMLPKNSILFSSRAPIGYIAIAKNEVCTNQGFKSLILKESIDTKYFYYWLKCNMDYVKLFGTGATFPEISGSAMKNIKVEIFNDKAYQEKISSILFKYDQLIKNNNDRIELLEQIAENLFKQWFVRFKYTENNLNFKKSPLGKIPMNFNVVSIESVLDYHIGGGWGSDNEDDEFSVPAFVIRGTDFPSVSRGDVSTCPYRYHKKSNYKTRKLQKNDIILEISGGTQEQPVGRAVLISDSILNQLKNKAICASFCKLIRTNNKVSANYFYYWLNYLYETRMIDRFQVQSTGIINFKFEYFLRKGELLLPPTDLMLKFDEITISIKNKIDKLSEINKNLMEQRDSLLPRLMSGKINLEVKEIV